MEQSVYESNLRVIITCMHYPSMYVYIYMLPFSVFETVIFC